MENNRLQDIPAILPGYLKEFNIKKNKSSFVISQLTYELREKYQHVDEVFDNFQVTSFHRL